MANQDFQQIGLNICNFSVGSGFHPADRRGEDEAALAFTAQKKICVHLRSKNPTSAMRRRQLPMANLRILHPHSNYERLKCRNDAGCLLITLALSERRPPMGYVDRSEDRGNADITLAASPLHVRRGIFFPQIDADLCFGCQPFVYDMAADTQFVLVACSS